jgi:site-specific recombinase XerC
MTEHTEITDLTAAAVHVVLPDPNLAPHLDGQAARHRIRTRNRANPRQLAVRRLAAWLMATEQLRGHPFVGIKSPAQRYPIVTPLSDDELRALIAVADREPASGKGGRGRTIPVGPTTSQAVMAHLDLPGRALPRVALGLAAGACRS